MEVVVSLASRGSVFYQIAVGRLLPSSLLGATKLQPIIRTCRKAELRVLANQRDRLIRSKHKQAKSVMQVGVVIFGILAVLTILTSDAPPIVIVTFWCIVGFLMSLYVSTSERREISQKIREFDHAIELGQAEEYKIVSCRFWELEEMQGEVPSYAFELPSCQVVFFTGQAFYPAANFPSLDFSFIIVRDSKGETLEMFLDKRGPKSFPDRCLTGQEHGDLLIPEELSVMEGRLEEVFEKIKVETAHLMKSRYGK